MPIRSYRTVIALVALVALVAVSAGPAPHDHPGKPGSVCHICSAVQPIALASSTATAGPALRLAGVLGGTEPQGATAAVVSQPIPRAPPA